PDLRVDRAADGRRARQARADLRPLPPDWNAAPPAPRRGALCRPLARATRRDHGLDEVGRDAGAHALTAEGHAIDADSLRRARRRPRRPDPARRADLPPLRRAYWW